MEKVKNQTKIVDLFPELSYEELGKVMDAWLNPEKQAENQEPSTEESSSESEETTEPEVVATVKAPSPVVETKSPTTETAKSSKTLSAKETADEFDKLFKN